MRALPLLTLLLLGPGCAVGLAEASVEPTGCNEEDIRVRNAHTPFLGQGAPTQWNATCNGVTYYCTQMRDRVICSEDPRDGATETAKPK
jgi:hypothetical protein